MILLEEQLNKDDGVLRRQFVQYLECPSSVENMCKNTLYVYTSTVKKVIKEEIEVDEELSELEIQSMKEFDEKRGKKKHQDKKKKKKHAQADDTIASVESPATDSDKDSDDGKSRDGYSSPDTAIQMSVGDGMKKNSEKMYKRVKVVQEKSITLPEIHVNFGLIPITTKLDITYLYFIKNTISAIPVYDAPEEADYYMPSKFLVGNKSGSLIRSMTKELETIWIPSIERLLIDPFSHDCWTTRTEQNTVLKLRSNSVPSTFVRITREIKSHHDYEMLVDERPADFEQRSNFVDLDKVITFSELFMLQPLPNHNTDDPRSFEPLKQHFLTELRDLLNKIKW
ncbi:uncharacterized protein LOC126840904 [Adelges cooleyi]|uniref:uncharacterized protein LOC126840904 n=1 Tax=Adelges cooleyi TaxID=133065 RepID=UPI0021808B3F|nr:uncharacterized protein LOC126840904 [Adelges cooleyi]